MSAIENNVRIPYTLEEKYNLKKSLTEELSLDNYFSSFQRADVDLSTWTFDKEDFMEELLSELLNEYTEEDPYAYLELCYIEVSEEDYDKDFQWVGNSSLVKFHNNSPIIPRISPIDNIIFDSDESYKLFVLPYNLYLTLKGGLVDYPAMDETTITTVYKNAYISDYSIPVPIFATRITSDEGIVSSTGIINIYELQLELSGKSLNVSDAVFDWRDWDISAYKGLYDSEWRDYETQVKEGSWGFSGSSDGARSLRLKSKHKYNNPEFYVSILKQNNGNYWLMNYPNQYYVENSKIFPTSGSAIYSQSSAMSSYAGGTPSWYGFDHLFEGTHFQCINPNSFVLAKLNSFDIYSENGYVYIELNSTIRMTYATFVNN